MLIAWDNKIDSATITAGSEIATLPATNVQDTRLSRKWHTQNDGGGSSVKASHLLFDMGAAVSADLLAVLGTNLSAAATMRLRASSLDPKALGSTRYDSGWISGGVKANYNAIYKAFKASYMTLDAAEVPTFYLDLTTGSIAPLIGDVTPTFTRATTATITDFEGLVRLVKSGEARFQGARRVENLVATKSEDWSNAAWTKTTMTATAGDLTATAGNATCLQSLTRASANYQLRVKMRRKTGSGNVQITIDNASFTTVTLTAYDQVFAISQNGVTNPNFGIRIVTNNDAIYASEIQLEDVTGQANTNPGEYVSVGVIAAAPYHGANVDGVKYFPWQNGNTVASNIVTLAQGAMISTSINLGYLPEGARTNLCLRSEEFDDAAWMLTGLNGITANAVTAPNGKTTADKLLEDGSTGQHRAYQNVVMGAAIHTISIFAKKAERDWLQFYFVGPDGVGRGGYFDLANGMVGSAFGSATLAIKAYANGWYKCSATATAGAGGTTTYINVGLAIGDGSFSFTGTLNNGAYVWGSQIEQAGFGSSYVGTTSASATRNKDQLTAPLTGWYNTTAGTLLAMAQVADESAAMTIASINDTTNNESIWIGHTTSGRGYAEVRDGGALQASLNTGSGWGTFDSGVIAFAYQANDFAASVDGGALSTDAAGTLPVPTRLEFGETGGSFPMCGTIARFAYYGERLPNATLQAAGQSVEHTVSARYWRLDLADTTLTDNLQVGRVFLGPSWETAVPQEYGWAPYYEDRSEITETDGGQEYADELSRRRIVEFDLNWLGKAEAMEKALEIQRAAGIVHDVLVIPEIDDPYMAQGQAIWGRLTALSPIPQRTPTAWSTRYALRETL